MHLRTPVLRLLVAAFFLAACAEENRANPFTPPDVPDDLARFDAGPETSDDALDASPPPDVRTQCFNNNAFCPMGQVCIGGYCAPDPCSSAENVCGADRCLARCVPLRDPCAGVRCGARETCIEGRCIAGCYAAP